MQTNHTLPEGPFVKRVGWIAACLFLIIAIAIDAMYFSYARHKLNDFGSFYASGIKSRNGENPYDTNSEYILEINFSRIGAGGKMVNLNPPISIIIFGFLSRFNPYQALAVWRIVSAILYAGLILLLTSVYRRNTTVTKFIWSFTLAGIWHTLELGQIYVFLLIFTVLGWVYLQKGKYILAGIAIGAVVAIKPNFIIWTVFLLVSGYYITALISIITSLIISLVPVIIYGPQIYSQWLEASALRYATLIMPGNNSILGLTARFHAINLGIALSIALVAALLILSKWKRPCDVQPAEYISALGILASLLASPISWTGYTILILPIFFSLKKWSPLVIASAAIFSIPFVIVLQLHETSFTSFLIFGWLYGWGILLLVGEIVNSAVSIKSVPAN